MLLLALLLVLAASLLGSWAQRVVLQKFRLYQKVPNLAGLSGAEAARLILRHARMTDIKVERVDGVLQDHYDPRQRVLSLSAPVFDGRHLAALGVAAHEVGHALQQASHYPLLAIRNFSVPSARLGQVIGVPLLLFGSLFQLPFLALFGLALYLGVVLFQLLTLPVELDASRRALVALDQLGFVRTQAEVEGVAAVLNAAALTYVAAALAGLSMLFYYLVLFFGGRRN